VITIDCKNKLSYNFKKMGMHLKNPMNRRDFLRLLGVGTASLTLPEHKSDFDRLSGGKPKNKPNILLIMSDEHNVSVTGCFGNKIVNTQNMDYLAKNGITFDNCYCNSPLCVPSRLSFTSGKYASRIGAWSNHSWLPSPDYPSLQRQLNRAGYESYLCGKMHYDRTRKYGFTKEIFESVYNQEMKDGKGGRRDPDILDSPPGISERFGGFHAGDSSEVLDHDSRVTKEAVKFLKNCNPEENPFFLVCGYYAPHEPLVVSQKYWDFYRDKVPLPVIPPGHLESLPRNYQHLRVAFNVDDTPEDIVKKGRELYYGLTQWLDEEIGRILSTLKESRFAGDTIIIYTTDHGENMGEHGMWWKNCMFESATHVPLIVSWPSRWKGPQRRTEVCSLLDVVQTIADLAGAETPDDWNGDSMLEWMDDNNTKWKDFAVSEYFGHNICSGYVMCRLGDYKYVYHTKPDEYHSSEYELYDLNNDPGEYNNLAANPRYKDVMDTMHSRIVAEIGENPDMTELRCRADYAKGGYDRPELKKK
jgi:choline-sulfatase